MDREPPQTLMAGEMGVPVSLLLVGLTAFFTLVDLFGTQAILPTLVQHYHVSPAAMGIAVNGSTIGMAASGLLVALFGQAFDRRRGTFWSLALLSVPTALLSIAPTLSIFFALRICQGLFMAAAFAWTLAYVAENATARDAAGASSAYITGNVGSNLLGRVVAAALTVDLGLEANFLLFAVLNLVGAATVLVLMRQARPMTAPVFRGKAMHPWDALLMHLRRSDLCAAFAVGFLILFAFIGIFTYVNFVLVRPPLNLSAMSLGLVYAVFIPSLLTTPLAGRMSARFGIRAAMISGLGTALLGLLLLIAPRLPAVLAGLVLAGAGTFFAQAAATGFVGRAATSERAAANGLYLACYFTGGLAGAACLGQVFDAFGWPACVLAVGGALSAALALSFAMQTPAAAAT